MAKDDFFYIAYKILAYVYETMKKGEAVDPKVFDAEHYRVNYNYLYRIFQELSDEGYIKGLNFTPTKDGILVTGFNNLSITIKGIEFLQENSMMKKAYNTIKEVKDWIPGM